MRNFAILHIVADESRIFRTKERAPVMLCFEVYRPIELSLEKKPGFLDFTKDEKLLIVKEEIEADFDPEQKRKLSRSTVIRSSADQSFYPFDSMNSA